MTGPVRDLDVLLEHLAEELRGLSELDQAAGAALVAALDTERAQAQRRLEDGLHSNAYRVVSRGRLRFPPRLASDVEGIPLEKVARREFRRLGKAVGRVTKSPDDAALHGLRIALKRARYAADSGPEWRQGAGDFSPTRRLLQTLLGEHQDAVRRRGPFAIGDGRG